MLPVERVIGEEGLQLDGSELRLAVRLPWYRSLPISTIEIAELEVDGIAIATERIQLEIDGRRWPLEEIGDQTDVFWFVLDSAYLIIPTDLLIDAETHEVRLRIAIYPPYIPGMRRENGQREVLHVQVGNV